MKTNMEIYRQHMEPVKFTYLNMKLNRLNCMRKCAIQEQHEKMIHQMKVSTDFKNFCSLDIDGQKNPSKCKIQKNYRNLIYAKLRNNKLNSIIFPVVFADSPKIENDNNEIQELTTMDKLMQIQRQEKPGLVSDAEVKQYIENETGKDRFDMLFKRGFDNQYHPDLLEIANNVKLYTFCTFFVAAVYGGKISREKFITKHKGTKWPTKFLAARAAQDAIFLGGIRHGLVWGTRMAIFSTSFLLICKSIETYRNKSGVREYVTAGGVTCAFLRFDLGLKGMLAGGVIGSFLGLCAGLGICALLHASGETQDSRHYWYITHVLESKRALEQFSPKEIETSGEYTSQVAVPQS